MPTSSARSSATTPSRPAGLFEQLKEGGYDALRGVRTHRFLEQALASPRLRAPAQATRAYYLGEALQASGRTAEACAAYQRAREQAPLYEGIPRTPRFLEQALASPRLRAPAQATRAYYLGEALQASGRTAEACAAYQRAREQAPLSRYGRRAAERLQAMPAAPAR